MSTTVKMIRERLCAAERSHDIATLYGAVIALCDVLRPLGPNGKHGSRHTPLCGCEDVAPARPDVSGGYLVIGAPAKPADDDDAADEPRCLDVFAVGGQDALSCERFAGHRGMHWANDPAHHPTAAEVAPGRAQDASGSGNDTRVVCEPHRGVQSLADDLREFAVGLAGGTWVPGHAARVAEGFADRAEAVEGERDRLDAWKREALMVLERYDDLARRMVPEPTLGRNWSDMLAEHVDAVTAERDEAEAAVARVRALLDRPLIPSALLRDALDGMDAGGEGGAADDERAVLNRLRALSADRDEYLLRLRQAEHIAQVGGVDDETLQGLLHLAVAGQVTPSVERALRRVGIDVRCHDHDHPQHDERPVSGAGMGERE